jgi:hypothetical protein
MEAKTARAMPTGMRADPEDEPAIFDDLNSEQNTYYSIAKRL